MGRNTCNNAWKLPKFVATLESVHPGSLTNSNRRNSKRFTMRDIIYSNYPKLNTESWKYQSVCHLQGNANQNHRKIPVYIQKDSYSKNKK